MTEDQIKYYLEKARNGDVAAFEKLVALHERQLYSFALSVTAGNHADAGDIYQEAIIKAFLNIKKFEARSSFKTWLWRIVKNEFINYIKSPKTRGAITLDLDQHPLISDEEHDCQVVDDERKRNLRKLISMLSVQHQEVITLVDLQELSHSEASEIIGIKVSACKVRLHRAREKLAELAFEHEELF